MREGALRTGIVAGALAGALVLGGCAQLGDAPASAGQEAPIEARADSGSLLEYFARLRRLSAAELLRERELARRALAAEPGDERRMRYAIALSVSIDGSVEAARALDLVDPVAKRRDSPYQALAITMRSLLSDLSQAQRERAELQRERTELQRERTELQRERTELLRERAELQRKLDSLKALEKSLSDREGGTK